MSQDLGKKGERSFCERACCKEAESLIKQGKDLLEMLDREKASLILGTEWDKSQVRIDLDEVENFRKKQQQASASVLTFYIVNNVCLLKIRSKHSSNTLLRLLRIFIRQTLI